jgi:hypothetical protein
LEKTLPVGGGRRTGAARATLERAKFFFRHAAISSDDANGFEHHLNACIVFGRSVTFTLQAEFAGRPGFDAWYAEHAEGFREDPLCRFLLKERNFILKEGPTRISQQTRRSMIHGSLPMGWIVVPPRSAPLGRRLLSLLLRPIHRLQLRWFFFRERLRNRRLPMETWATALYFDDPAFATAPAVALLKEPRWTPQNRPYVDGAKPAIEADAQASEL